MKEEVLNFLSVLGMTGADPCKVGHLCRVVCGELDSMLADGVKHEDCAEAYLHAAVLMVVEWLDITNRLEGVNFLSVGDLSIRRDLNCEDRRDRVLEIMAPWLKDRGFVFRGVRG